MRTLDELGISPAQADNVPRHRHTGLTTGFDEPNNQTGGMKMTNGEKYKTAKERADAFLRFCDSNKDDCASCKLRNNSCEPRTCAFHWLDLEAEAEEPLPCPFCEEQCSVKFNFEDRLVVECSCCNYSSASYDDETQAVAAHNRVARAAKEKEANDANA